MEKNEATTTAIENKRGRLDLRWTILFLNCLATVIKNINKLDWGLLLYRYSWSITSFV